MPAVVAWLRGSRLRSTSTRVTVTVACLSGCEGVGVFPKTTLSLPDGRLG